VQNEKKADIVDLGVAYAVPAKSYQRNQIKALKFGYPELQSYDF